MPKIIVKRKAEIYREFPIRPFQNRITIGSEGDNDLIILDKKVSMHHLVIQKEGTNYYVIDKDSAFGTYVNGHKIDVKTSIMNGDEITIGEHNLLFENVLFEKDVKTYIPSEKDNATIESISLTQQPPDGMKLLPNIKDDGLEKVKDQISSQEIKNHEKTPYYLFAIYGPYLGKRYRLNFDVTKIGRDSTLNDIIIRENSKGEIDTSVSRRHASIFYENNEFYITDKRSKTRTYVNKNILQEDSIERLESGDEIEIVSDQKSTIFRFVPEGLWDYSPPKKSGDWWIRNSLKLTKIITVVLILGLLINLVIKWKNLSLIKQKPSPLNVIEQIWLSEDNPIDGFNQPEEIANLTFSMTPLIADLNGDNVNDLLYVDKIGYLHAIDGSRRHSLWSASYKYRIQFPLYPVLADLNGNKLSDVVFPSTDSRLYAIDGHTGTVIWYSPLIAGDLSGAPAIANINRDQIPDVLFCTKQGEVVVGYGAYGDPNWVNHQTNSEIRCIPMAGDFNGDGIAEVAFGTENGQIFIFSGIVNNFNKVIDINEELQKAKGSFFEDHQIRGHIAIGDLDGDRCDDLLITTLQGNILTISGKHFKRLWYDELMTNEPFFSKSYIPTALGDIDGDKDLDAAIFSFDNKIIAYRGKGQPNGQKKILWGFVPETYENYIAHPVVVDINKDGYSDIIAAGLYGGLNIFDGKSGKILWQHANTSNLDQAIISTPLVADMEGDKKLDIVIRRANGKFYNITTNARIPKNTIFWGQVNYNAAHTGSLLYSGKSTKYIVSIIFSLLLIVGLLLVNFYLIIKRKKSFATI